MIRSSKVTTKYANTEKLVQLNELISEYTRVVKTFVDILWEQSDVKSLLDNDITSQVDTWLSARMVQCAGKQASGIVRGTRKKQKKRLAVITKMKKNGEFKKARKLQAKYDSVKISKPVIKTVQPELDARFCDIVLENETSFDGWVTISSIGRGMKIVLPFKSHKHLNQMLSEGKIKCGCRIAPDKITFMFEMPDPVKPESGRTIGIDIGQKTTLSCSSGQTIEADNHGHTYQSICNRLARKTKNSNAFKRTQKHRTNYLHWCANRIDLRGVKQVNLEDIKDMRRYKRTRRALSHWNYSELFDVLEMKLEGSGVQIHKVNPTYTSQRCSVCGWVCKANRKAKKFRCTSCGHTADADLNASNNLSLDLIPLGNQKHLSKANRTGFYWHETCRERTVPDALKL